MERKGRALPYGIMPTNKIDGNSKSPFGNVGWFLAGLLSGCQGWWVAVWCEAGCQLSLKASSEKYLLIKGEFTGKNLEDTKLTRWSRWASSGRERVTHVPPDVMCWVEHSLFSVVSCSECTAWVWTWRNIGWTQGEKHLKKWQAHIL